MSHSGASMGTMSHKCGTYESEWSKCEKKRKESVWIITIFRIGWSMTASYTQCIRLTKAIFKCSSIQMVTLIWLLLQGFIQHIYSVSAKLSIPILIMWCTIPMDKSVIDPFMKYIHWPISVFSHFYHGWPVSGCVIIGISNSSVDVANHMEIGLVMGQQTVKFKWPPVSQQWGWWANGAADSRFGGLMGWPTGQVQVTTSQPTVGLVG